MKETNKPRDDERKDQTNHVAMKETNKPRDDEERNK